MAPNNENFSSIGYNKYPTNRDAQPKSALNWLKGKVADDELAGEGINGRPVWRIHNKLYDFTDFISKHPGGSEWFNLLQNSDITEAYEAHHPNINVTKSILEKYYLKDINKPRNSPFTFEENGFYQTLRRKVLPIIQQQGKGSSIRMKLLQDSLVIIWFILLVLAVNSNSFYLAILSGILLGMSTICAHNYFHQANNWRMYIFDLSFFSSHQWRISHALSHHLYPNTIYDFEISMLEPLFCFLPQKKNFIQRHFVYIYIHIFYCLAIPIEVLKRFKGIVTGNIKLRPEYLLPLFPFVILLVINPSLDTFYIWGTMHLASSFWFSFIGLIAGHHHPEIWHEGDQPTYESQDWGIFQLDAVRDRFVVSKNLFLVSTMFGDHSLHHLFPTVDHSKLAALYPVFIETCKEFGVNWEEKTILSMAIGKYRQLRRITPRKNKSN